MAQTLEVACEGSSSRFTLRRLSRSTLYGRTRRVPVDPQGRECRAAALTRDGRFLLPPGSTATLYLDDAGDVVEREELHSDGDASDAEQAAEPETAGPGQLLDCTVRRVYVLEPVAVSEPLEGLLGATGVCRLAEADGRGQAQFLVKNDTGYFLLVGEETDFEFLGPTQADLSVPDADAPWDDLDFAMMG
jgi:hypothetical protein